MPPATINVAALLSKITWRLLPFLMVLYVVSYLDRINLSFAALQMLADLHFSSEVYGQGSGIFFLGYCVFGIPSNLVIARLGPRLWISIIMVLWGLITVAMCLVHDTTSFYALRLILGIAEAGFFPGMLLYLTYWFPPKQYGMAVARFMTAVPLAGLVGSLMAAKTLAMGGILGLAGWKWLFIITGVPAVLLGIGVFCFLSDTPGQAKWLSEGEKQTLAGLVETKKEGGGGAASILAAFRSFLVWRAAALYFSMSVCMYGFQLWLPQIIQTFGRTSDSQTALLSAIPALAQGLGMQLIAASSDKQNERRFHVVASAAITCAGLMAACLLTTPVAKLSGLSLAAFGIWGTVGPFWALTRQTLPVKAQPTGIAFINSVGGLGGYVGPYLVGLVQTLTAKTQGANVNFNSALILLAVAAGLTAVLAIVTKPAAIDPA